MRHKRNDAPSMEEQGQQMDLTQMLKALLEEREKCDAALLKPREQRDAELAEERRLREEERRTRELRRDARRAPSTRGGDGEERGGKPTIDGKSEVPRGRGTEAG